MKKIFLLGLLAFIFTSCGSGTPPPVDLIIEEVRVVDTSGTAPRVATVIVHGGRIRAVVAPEAVPKQECRVRFDGRGRTLIPGLWDDG